MAAERGGAQRIELCSELHVGGLTPDRELMRLVRNSVKIPVFAMIRPRPGDFYYSDLERIRMGQEIQRAQGAGMNGVVLGLLVPLRGPRVDVERTQMMVGRDKSFPLTFHRAFDEAVDLDAGLTDVMRTGAARLLTSGGAKDAHAGADTLARLVAAAKERVIIVPGGGINSSNIAEVARRTGAHEFHSALGSVLPYGQKDYEAFAREVRKMAEALANFDAMKNKGRSEMPRP